MLEYPASNRQRLEKPEKVTGEWSIYVSNGYDSELDLLRDEHAIDYIDRQRRETYYFEPDEYVMYLQQYWYNHREPQLTGIPARRRPAPQTKVVW